MCPFSPSRCTTEPIGNTYIPRNKTRRASYSIQDPSFGSRQTTGSPRDSEDPSLSGRLYPTIMQMTKLARWKPVFHRFPLQTSGFSTSMVHDSLKQGITDPRFRSATGKRGCFTTDSTNVPGAVGLATAGLARRLVERLGVLAEL